MKKRIISIDFGLARIGIALSDEMGIIATPLDTLPTQKTMKETVAFVKRKIEELEKENACTIQEVVIGLPLHMDGREGVMADEVKLFAKQLEETGSLTIHQWDERLSSVQADRSLREGGLTRKKRAKSVDRVSAAIILQSFLDSRS